MLRACPEVPMYGWRVQARLWEATGHGSYFMGPEPDLSCTFVQLVLKEWTWPATEATVGF